MSTNSFSPTALYMLGCLNDEKTLCSLDLGIYVSLTGKLVERHPGTVEFNAEAILHRTLRTSRVGHFLPFSTCQNDGDTAPVIGFLGWLDAGQDHDSLLASNPPIELRYIGVLLVADGAYGPDAIRELVREHGAWANTPPKQNRNKPNLPQPVYIPRPQSASRRSPPS
jgi:hypothetical protein